MRVRVPTPFGPIVLLAGERGLRGLVLPPPPLLSPRPRGEPHAPSHAEEGDEDTGGWLAAAARQVRQYLLGLGCRLEAPLDLRGSPFELRVWATARRIPYGATVTYGELASRLGDARLARAVGRALSRNPVPLFVPCHRVVAAGNLGGFSAGRWWKLRLLALEGHPLPTRHTRDTGAPPAPPLSADGHLAPGPPLPPTEARCGPGSLSIRCSRS